MWSSFAKRFTKNDSTPQIELFTELKHKQNGFTEGSRTKRVLRLFTRQQIKEAVHTYRFINKYV
jgi:hypothetical protein